MGFRDLFRSSMDSKPPSSSRMPTGHYPPSSSHYMPPLSPVNRPHTSSSSKLKRKNAVKHDFPAGHYDDRIVRVPWVRPDTAYRQPPPQDMSYGMPPASIPMPSSSSSSSSRKPKVSPPTLRREDAFRHDTGSPTADFSSMFPHMDFTPAKTDRATSSRGYDNAAVPHAPAHIPAYTFGPNPAPPPSRKPSKSRSSNRRPQTSTGSSSHASSVYPPSSDAYYPPSTSTSYTTPTRAPSTRPSSSRAQPSYQPSASYSHQRYFSRDSNGVSPLWASFPLEVQRVMGSDFGSGSVSRNMSQSSSRGVSRSTSRSSARAAAHYSLDNDTSCFGNNYNGVYHTHGGNALGIYPGSYI